MWKKASLFLQGQKEKEWISYRVRYIKTKASDPIRTLNLSIHGKNKTRMVDYMRNSVLYHSFFYLFNLSYFFVSVTESFFFFSATESLFDHFALHNVESVLLKDPEYAKCRFVVENVGCNMSKTIDLSKGLNLICCGFHGSKIATVLHKCVRKLISQTCGKACRCYYEGRTKGKKVHLIPGPIIPTLKQMPLQLRN